MGGGNSYFVFIEMSILLLNDKEIFTVITIANAANVPSKMHI